MKRGPSKSPKVVERETHSPLEELEWEPPTPPSPRYTGIVSIEGAFHLNFKNR